jgi:isopentenyldiphosphate isomerase
MRFVPADDLNDELAATPDKFTPWLKLEWQRLSKEFAAVLAKYSVPD